MNSICPILVLTIAAVASTVQELSSERELPLATTVARVAGRGLMRFELRRDEQAQVPRYAAELVMRAVDVKTTEPDTALWRGPWMVPGNIDWLSFASVDGGRWAIVGSSHTGGGRAVEIWSGEAVTLAGGRSDPDATVKQTAVLEVELENALSEETGRSALMRDLPSPQLFVWNERIYLVAAGMGDRRIPKDDRELVWMAPLPGPDEVSPIGRIRGRSVGDGVDPRIVVHSGEAILSMRVAFNPLVQKGEAPVRFYRSTDLANWVPDLGMWQGVSARANYGFSAAGGCFWVASTKDVEGGAGLVIWCFDPTSPSQIWESHPRMDPVHERARSHADRVWLISPTSADTKVPEVLCTNPSGTLERRRWR